MLRASPDPAVEGGGGGTILGHAVIQGDPLRSMD